MSECDTMKFLTNSTLEHRYLLPHPEFQKQVVQMKKLKKLLKGGVKKLINNAEFVAVEQACFKHRNRRKYLCVSLRQISNFLRVSPGLVGPKFPIIVSALSVVRHELEWYMVFNRNSSNTTNIILHHS